MFFICFFFFFSSRRRHTRSLRDWSSDVCSSDLVHGNSIATLNAKGRPRLMLAGHIDEIGLQVTHIDDDGYLYFAGIGGWDPQVLVGQRVVILGAKEPVSGVIG